MFDEDPYGVHSALFTLALILAGLAGMIYALWDTPLPRC